MNLHGNAALSWSGRRELARRLVVQLSLPLLAVLAFLPTLRAAAAPSADADLGRHVYQAIRALRAQGLGRAIEHADGGYLLRL